MFNQIRSSEQNETLKSNANSDVFPSIRLQWTANTVLKRLVFFITLELERKKKFVV